MDGDTENEENNRVMSADSSNEEDKSPLTVNGSVPAEMVASAHDEENSEAPVEEAATSEQEGNSRTEIQGVDDITTSEDLDVKMNEVNEQPLSHEESVVLKINSDDGTPRLHLETPEETPERQNTSPTQEKEEADDEESTGTHAEKEDINYEEYMLLLQDQCEIRDKASHHHNLLQMKLADFLCKKAGKDTLLDRETLESEQLQQYEKYINVLADLKQKLTTDSKRTQHLAEELRFKLQEKLDKVENEWQAFMALKQDVAVTVLSQSLGKQAAQAKVEATLAKEKLLQHKLIKQRLKHIKLRTKIHGLEAELQEGEEDPRDPLHVQFEELQAARLELKKQTEKQNEESLKMQKKIISSLEVLSNVKEKLFWSQMEVQAKQEQLAKVEAMVARKRDILTRTRKVRNSLQRNNLRLKQHHGLLGNRVLLRDFEDTVDASDHLEERLEDLKCQQSEIVFIGDSLKNK